MKKLDETLKSWVEIPAEDVPVGKIKLDAALQPRNEHVVPFPDKAKHELASAGHIERLRLILDASINTQLEPVLVARVGRALYLVDGHHRLRAYRSAGRHNIPARAFDMPMKTAVALSKLVNLNGIRLPMHKSQCSESAWQSLALATDRGKLKLAEGESTRSIGARFGIGRNTVSRMLERLSTVNPDEHDRNFCDLGTGWPRWKDVRGNSWKDGYTQMQPEQRTQWQGERFAKQLVKLLGKFDQEATRYGIQLIKNDAESERLEDLACIEELVPADDFN